MLSQGSQELKNGNLKERILNSSNLILCVMFLGNQSVGPSNFGNQINQVISKRLINLNNILQKSSATEQDSVTFLFKTS